MGEHSGKRRFIGCISFLTLVMGLLVMILGILLYVRLGKYKVVWDTLNIDFSLIAVPAGLIAVGLFIGLLSACGLAGAWFTIRPLLVAYGVILLLLVIGQVTMAVMVGLFRNKALEIFEDSVRKTVMNYRNNDAINYGWDLLMVEMDCCGLSGPKDFWKNELSPKFMRDAKQVGCDPGKCFPAACCGEATQELTVTSCTQSNKGFHETGCTQALKSHLSVPAVIGIIVVLSLLVVLQLAVSIMAIKVGRTRKPRGVFHTTD